jgi:hypothetical protein
MMVMPSKFGNFYALEKTFAMKTQQTVLQSENCYTAIFIMSVLVRNCYLFISAHCDYPDTSSRIGSAKRKQD